MGSFLQDFKTGIPFFLLLLPIFIVIAIPAGMVLRAIAASHYERKREQALRDANDDRAKADAAPRPVRHDDALQLTPQQMELKHKAAALVEQGKILEGASIYEQLTLNRTAIDVLEKHGHYDEACQILVRMQRPNRAGVLCLRNNRPIQAALYFLQAEMMEDAAKAYMEAAHTDFRYYEAAAEVFEKNGQQLEAAQAYSKILNSQKVFQICCKHAFHDILLPYMLDPVNANTILQAASQEELRSLAENLPENPLAAQQFAHLVATHKLFQLIAPTCKAMHQNWLTGWFLSFMPTEGIAALEGDVQDLRQRNPREANHLLLQAGHGMLAVQHFGEAAKYFSLASDHSSAAFAFIHAGNIDAGVAQLTQAGKHDVVKAVQTQVQAYQKSTGTPEDVRALWEKMFALVDALQPRQADAAKK